MRDKNGTFSEYEIVGFDITRCKYSLAHVRSVFYDVVLLWSFRYGCQLYIGFGEVLWDRRLDVGYKFSVAVWVGVLYYEIRGGIFVSGRDGRDFDGIE